MSIEHELNKVNQLGKIAYCTLVLAFQSDYMKNKVHTIVRSSLYQDGAITLFALNMDPVTTSYLVFSDSILRDHSFDVYMISSLNGILSR